MNSISLLPSMKTLYCDFQLIVMFLDTDIETLLVDKLVQHTDEHGRKVWMCTQCDYVKAHKHDVMKHVERKHLNLQIPCHVCSTLCKSRNDLKSHMKTHVL